MIQQNFPRHLLDLPVKERVEYFQKYLMAHAIMVEVLEELRRTIYQAGGPSLIFLLGPTGVGKTTLLKYLVNKIIKDAQEKMQVDLGYIPIAGISAVSPEFSQFDWQDFYIRGLKALMEPLIDKKISYKDSKRKLRFAFEDALQYRHPDLFYIDEAQELRKVPTTRKLRDQTDCLKSISNNSSVRLLLTATYEADMLLDLSDQLCRRSVTIDFPRYRIDSRKEQMRFKSVITSLISHLPLIESPDFSEEWEYIYERTCGCVGILKDWFTRTLGAVLEDDEKATTITLKQLQKQALPVNKCLIIFKAIKSGEDKLKENEESLIELRRGLGIAKEEPKAAKQPKSSPRRDVGKPNPKAYPIGTVKPDEQSEKSEDLEGITSL